MSTMVEVWKAEGMAEARAEAKAEAKAEGRAEGELKRAKVNVLRVLAKYHDHVPETVAEQVQSITDIETLDRLFDIALDSQSLEEFVRHLS